MGEQIADRHNPSRQLKVNEDGSIDATLVNGDIQIGAVEIKDATTTTRAKVKTDGTDNAQVVMANVLPLPAGAATSAKQLADDHNVTANAGTNLNTSALATEATMTADLQSIEDNQTDGSQLAQLVDAAGNKIDSEADHLGKYHLAVTANQDVNVDTNNSSTTNLDAANSYTFTGTATSTLGVVGLQWSLNTDQNATVYIEESDDESNWDISRSFDYIANRGGRGETVQASKAFWRIRVVLTGTIDTTEFRLSAVLCPIAFPLPSALSADGRLLSESTLSGKENAERHVWVSPTNSLTTNTQVRLVGTNFDGTTKDTNFWTETVTNGGTVVQTGEIKLQTNTTANGTAKYVSVRRARFVVGAAQLFQGIYKFNDTVTEADNVRRCGAYDTNNGYFFELDSGVFSVGTRKTDGTPTLVSSGDFNGNYGPTWTPLATAYYKFSIEYTPSGAFYYINGKLLHKSIGGHLTRFLTLPITMENINDNNNATAVIFDCLGVTIARQGELSTNPIGKYIGTNATTILKVGAGDLHRITVTDNSGTLLVYDGLSAAGVLMANLDASKTVGTMEFGMPFSDGLTVVSAGNPKMTVVYE